MNTNTPAQPAFTDADHDAVAGHLARHQLAFEARRQALDFALRACNDGTVSSEAPGPDDERSQRDIEIDEVMSLAEEFAGFLLGAQVADIATEHAADTNAGPGLTDAPPIAAAA